MTCISYFPQSCQMYSMQSLCCFCACFLEFKCSTAILKKLTPMTIFPWAVYHDIYSFSGQEQFQNMVHEDLETTVWWRLILPLPCPLSPHRLPKKGPLTPAASSQPYQGVLAQGYSAKGKTEIPHISLVGQWDDTSTFIFSQPQEIQLKLLKHTSEVDERVWPWEYRGLATVLLEEFVKLWLENVEPQRLIGRWSSTVNDFWTVNWSRPGCHPKSFQSNLRYLMCLCIVCVEFLKPLYL